MKQEHRHRSDDDLKNIMDGYAKKPSEKVWLNIQKNIYNRAVNSSRTSNWYNKFGFFSISIIVTIAIIAFNLTKIENEQIIYNDTGHDTLFTVKSGETTLYIFPETYKDALLNFNEIISAKNKDLTAINNLSKKNLKTIKEPLIRNGSFEIHEPIPHRNDRKLVREPWVKFSKIPYWNAGGIPDYYHPKRNKPNMWNNTPKSAHGITNAHDGVAYIGLVAHSASGYREYRYTELSQKLKKDKIYKIEFFIAKGNKGPSISDFGAYFTDQLIDYNQYKKGDMEINRSNYASLKNQFYYSGDFYKGGWRKITLHYTAKGNEKYLYLGSMIPITEVKLGNEPQIYEAQKEKNMINKNSRRRMNENYSYYFLDNVFISTLEEFEIKEAAIKNK